MGLRIMSASHVLGLHVSEEMVMSTQRDCVRKHWTVGCA